MTKIVKPYARIVGNLDGASLLKSIEAAARISHRSEDGTTDESYLRFIKAVVMDKGDWSIVEHVHVSVDFLVDRGITHELVRHRLFSYTQESTRFVNYEKKMPPSFIYPKEGLPSINWSLAIEQAEESYRVLLAEGWRPQEARSVLPNALASLIRMTGNLRSWRWFFQMRTTKEAHPQMREVTIPLLAEFQKTIPMLFDDITPNESQATSTARRH
jgi:thymidylate synthase (FAD)